MNQIIPTAEPFFFPASNEVGILLVHGFTGAPKEMRWMGEYLHQQGFTVLGVRLSGHATQPEDMIRSSYTDWLASVEDGYHLLSGAVKAIYIMGLSMGGILTLTTAAYLSPDCAGTSPLESTGTSPVKGLVAMSTPYALPPDPRLRHIEWISKAVPFMPKGDEEPGSSWFDKEAWKDHVSYPQNPLHAIGELNKLLGMMHSALPEIQKPVLLIHSRDDNYVVKDSMQQIYDHLGTPDKQMLWIEGSGHVITRDAQRQTVFKAAADFVRRVENQ
jgi:carboxylesterase